MIPRATIEELCRKRDEALGLYGGASAMLRRALRLHQEACVGESIAGVGRDQRVEDPRFGGEMHAVVDRDMWRALLRSTPLWSLMDQQERTRFENELRANPPPCRPDVVHATLERLQRESGMMFRRGLIQAWQNLDRRYKSHDGFSVGGRVVLTLAVEWDRRWGFSSVLPTYGESRMRDVDRIMWVLDGRKEPDYQQGLCAALRQCLARHRHDGVQEFETDYWRVRFYQNGAVHLWPKRQDLVARVNQMIAEHFGQTLGDKTQTRGTAGSRKPRRHRNDGWFRTPPDLARWIVECAGVKPGDVVLEPSAGDGAVARVAVQHGAVVHCIEIDPGRYRELAQHQYGSVHLGDFLETPASPLYDAVLMNPPFHDRADVQHVLHGWKFLRPGGRLVAIVSAGALTRARDVNSAELARLHRLYGGGLKVVPRGTFAGTDVEAMGIWMTKGDV